MLRKVKKYIGQDLIHEKVALTLFFEKSPELFMIIKK